MSDSQLESEFHRICHEHLKLEDSVCVERIHHVGNKMSRKPRLVVIKFLDFKERELVWSKRRSLKGTQLYLEEHFALEIQQR